MMDTEYNYDYYMFSQILSILKVFLKYFKKIKRVVFRI